MEKELDKLVDAEIERIQELKFFTALYNYEDEIIDLDEECCEECQQQATYYLKG